jgi:hypothetical protein
MNEQAGTRRHRECGHAWSDHKAEPALDGRSGCRAAVGLARCGCPEVYNGSNAQADHELRERLIGAGEMPASEREPQDNLEVYGDDVANEPDAAKRDERYYGPPVAGQPIAVDLEAEDYDQLVRRTGRYGSIWIDGRAVATLKIWSAVDKSLVAEATFPARTGVEHIFRNERAMLANPRARIGSTGQEIIPRFDEVLAEARQSISLQARRLGAEPRPGAGIFAGTVKAIMTVDPEMAGHAATVAIYANAQVEAEREAERATPTLKDGDIITIAHRRYHVGVRSQWLARYEGLSRNDDEQVWIQAEPAIIDGRAKDPGRTLVEGQRFYTEDARDGIMHLWEIKPNSEPYPGDDRWMARYVHQLVATA